MRRADETVAGEVRCQHGFQGTFLYTCARQPRTSTVLAHGLSSSHPYEDDIIINLGIQLARLHHLRVSSRASASVLVQ